MIIHAEHIFGCNHQFIARPHYFICATCRFTRDLLPIPPAKAHGLLTFPLAPAFLFGNAYVEATAALG